MVDRVKGTAKSRQASRPLRLDRPCIEAKALDYLNKFDASVARLRRVLSDFVRIRARKLEVDASPYLEAVNEIVVRYQENGLLNDHRFGATMARTLVERGASRQAIRTKLYGRGLAADVVVAVLSEFGSAADSELAAAQALVRKRKMGKYRAESERHASYRRDLGALARAGFDFETAKRALSVEGADDEEMTPRNGRRTTF